MLDLIIAAPVQNTNTVRTLSHLDDKMKLLNRGSKTTHLLEGTCGEVLQCLVKIVTVFLCVRRVSLGCFLFILFSRQITQGDLCSDPFSSKQPLLKSVTYMYCNFIIMLKYLQST